MRLNLPASRGEIYSKVLFTAVAETLGSRRKILRRALSSAMNNLSFNIILEFTVYT